MSQGERVEYLLGLRPVEHLREHVGDEAAEAFRAWWRHHLPLAKHFAGKFGGALGTSVEQLLGDAAVGLMSALARHDPARGSIATYAKRYVFGAIMHAVRRESPHHVRMSEHSARRVRVIKDHQRELRAAGVEPDFYDLAEASGIAPEAIRKMMALYPRHEHSLQDPMAFGAHHVRDEDDGRPPPGLSAEELIVDRESPLPGQELELRQEIAILERYMRETLDDRERFLLAMRFGLDGGEEQTLEEIGDLFGLSRGRIHQLCKVAIMKLQMRFGVDFTGSAFRGKKRRRAPSRCLPTG